jgi:DNA-binding transcriptional ArsR family regulator
MQFANAFVTYLPVMGAAVLVYLLQCIYISNFNLKINWTKRGIDWTKARAALLSRLVSAGVACNGAITRTAAALGRAGRRISGAYLQPFRERISAATTKLLRAALSWRGRRARRRGRGNVPQDAATGRIHLKATQKRVLAALRNAETAELTRGQYQEIAGVSRSQAAYDLAELVEAGVLRRLGGGRATRYRLARESRPGQRRWTNDRIRAELEDFCAGRKDWPSAGTFKSAGRADLYVAASRYGGIGFWAEELGFARPGRAASADSPKTPLRRRFASVGAGALASAAVAAAAAAIVVVSLQREPLRTAGPSRVSPPAASDESSRVLHTGTTAHRTVKKSVPQTHRRVARPVQRTPVRPVPTTSSNSTSLVSYRSYSPTTSSSGATSVPVKQAPASTPTASGGPTPLRAPSTGTGPTPLKAP